MRVADLWHRKAMTVDCRSVERPRRWGRRSCQWQTTREQSRLKYTIVPSSSGIVDAGVWKARCRSRRQNTQLTASRDSEKAGKFDDHFGSATEPDYRIEISSMSLSSWIDAVRLGRLLVNLDSLGVTESRPNLLLQ